MQIKVIKLIKSDFWVWGLSARPVSEVGGGGRASLPLLSFHLPASRNRITANLRTKTLDFRGFDSGVILIVKGWNFHAHWEFPRNYESTNLSRDNVSIRGGEGTVD